jgi:hypothetical protein
MSSLDRVSRRRKRVHQRAAAVSPVFTLEMSDSLRKGQQGMARQAQEGV